MAQTDKPRGHVHATVKLTHGFLEILVRFIKLSDLDQSHTEVVEKTLIGRSSFDSTLQIFNGAGVFTVVHQDVTKVVQVLGLIVVTFECSGERFQRFGAESFDFICDAEKVMGIP